MDRGDVGDPFTFEARPGSESGKEGWRSKHLLFPLGQTEDSTVDGDACRANARRYHSLLPAMDVNPRATSDLSDDSTVISLLDHNASRPPSNAFKGLPYELRAKIICTAAMDASKPSETRALLLVSKEFCEIVTPHHWRVCPLSLHLPWSPADDMIVSRFNRTSSGRERQKPNSSPSYMLDYPDMACSREPQPSFRDRAILVISMPPSKPP